MAHGIGAVLETDVEVRLLTLGALVVEKRIELQEGLRVTSQRVLNALLKLNHAPADRAVKESRLDCRIDRMFLEIVPAQRLVMTSTDRFPIVPFRADRYL